MPQNPIYTAENCKFAFQLRWGLTIFWTSPNFSEEWRPALRLAAAKDGIRILRHRFIDPLRSQFLASTRPETEPSAIIKSIKGRLQHLVRNERPQAFRRNYDLASIGSTKLEKVERYVRGQLTHHSMRSQRSPLSSQLEDLQFVDPDIDLTKPRFTGHGRFSCNLHLVFVRRDREPDSNFESLLAARDLIRRSSVKKKHLLSRLGILADHLHMTLGIYVDESPLEVALSYMNNVAYAYGMRDVLMHSCFIGGVGSYDLGAVQDE